MGIRLLAASLAGFPSYWIPNVDAWVIVVTFGLAAFSVLLFGLSPAWLSLKVDVAEAVKEGGRGSSGPSRRRLGGALVVAQIALAVVLLSAGSISLWAFLEARHYEAGFNMDHLLTVLVALPSGDQVDRAALAAILEERAKSFPGVASVTATNGLPLLLRATSFSIGEGPGASEEDGPRAVYLTATPDYLETMEFPLLRGRFFDRADREGTEPVAVVSQAVAERHWAQADALGKSIFVQGKSRRIVGIVRDIRLNIFDEVESSRGAVYVPFAQQPVAEELCLLVRSKVDPQPLVGPLRNELSGVDSRVSIGLTRSLHDWLDLLFSSDRYINVILTAFGLLAVLLAALGTYGVLAYNVAQRFHEIAVRMALGADPSRIVRIIIRHGAILGLIGLVIGIPGVIAVAGILESLLTSTPPINPLTIAAVFVVLFLSTLLASWLPARRAAGLDPMVVLRKE